MFQLIRELRPHSGRRRNSSPSGRPGQSMRAPAHHSLTSTRRLRVEKEVENRLVSSGVTNKSPGRQAYRQGLRRTDQYREQLKAASLIKVCVQDLGVTFLKEIKQRQCPKFNRRVQRLPMSCLQDRPLKYADQCMADRARSRPS